ncbi:hypothetical protein Tco_0209573 [Tanacetum coccineum]
MCSDDDMEKMVVTCKAVNPSGGDGGVILAGMRDFEENGLQGKHPELETTPADNNQQHFCHNAQLQAKIAKAYCRLGST